MTTHALSFSDLRLSPPLLKALEDMTFITPSPIQAQTIPLLLNGNHVIAQAQTGTGKTAAFALPILQNMSPQLAKTQALILAPTRELAIQVASQFELLSTHTPITVSVLCGGQDYSRQLKQLRQGAQVVVGTPGRILDHLDRGTLDVSHLSTFILDEADEMLRMGFIEDVETILAKLPVKKQIALFSATMPYRIRQIANRYLDNPTSVEIQADTATVKAIEQRFLFANGHQKPDALLRILAVEEYQGVIVFVRTKSSTEEVATVLQEEGYRAMAIHGDITQALREKIIAQFRQGAIDILVATDVAARGLDVDRVSLVINYDVPFDSETYVHRIGRTGRAGRSGLTILFVTPKESRTLTNIERHTRQRIQKIQPPTDEMIQEAKQKRFMSNISQRLESKHLASYQQAVENYVKENDASLLEVAAALAILANQDKPWHYESSRPAAPRMVREESFKDSKSSNRGKPSFKRDRDDKNRKPFQDRDKFQDRDNSQELFRLDVGRIHGVKPANIVGAIANEAGLESRLITGLKIHDDHSTVRLPKGMPKKIFQDLNKAWVCGRQLKITPVGSTV